MASLSLAPPTVRSPLRHLDVGAVNAAARREARSRQRHLPPVSAYRWWARRTESVAGAILDAHGKDHPGALLVADPFAGGGVLGLSTLIRGHRLYAQDVNPWAAASLTTMLTLPPPDELASAARRLEHEISDLLTNAYATQLRDGTPATTSHTLRVAIAECPGCGCELRLYPAAMVTRLARVDTLVENPGVYLACRSGHLTLTPCSERTSCPTCGRAIDPSVRYTRQRQVRCHTCAWRGSLSQLATNGLHWEPVLVVKNAGRRREIAPPTTTEHDQASSRHWPAPQGLPLIEGRRETRSLTRHGFRHWHDLYPPRQYALLSAIIEAAESIADENLPLAAALRAATLGAVEMAGFASRWDGRYLKAYEVVANHRYSFTTLPAEPNVWGAGDVGRGTISRRLAQLEKASIWLAERVGRSLRVEGPLLNSERRKRFPRASDARIVTGSSTRMVLPARSVDFVLTDPPYHDDVEYSDLSALFRAWAGLPSGALDGDAVATSGEEEGRYEATLTGIFSEVARTLKEGGHLILSYANRSPAAWVALIRALDSAGFLAVGFEVVHSENELDHAKSGKRACSLDVLIDCIRPPIAGRIRRFRPLTDPETNEEAFCRLVGQQALDIGNLKPGWEEKFVASLRDSPFLAVERQGSAL